MVNAAAAVLGADGRVLIEIGPDQAEAVTGLLEEAGFIDVDVRLDLAGRDRAIAARRP